MVSALFPVVCCADLDVARDFYARLLDLETTFESGWYTTMRSRHDSTVHIGFVESGHPTVPSSIGLAASGVLVSVLVADVDRIHDRALDMDARIVWPLTDEDFGQRHFMVADPTGLAVDVISLIKPSPTFLREVARRRKANR